MITKNDPLHKVCCLGHLNNGQLGVNPKESLNSQRSAKQKIKSSQLHKATKFWKDYDQLKRKHVTPRQIRQGTDITVLPHSGSISDPRSTQIAKGCGALREAKR